MNYRADIDGLRAIAVISVLLFHLNENFLSGGFVGVDIFFVISGYLITKLIVFEVVGTGEFSFRNFYVRRIRRLFPALIFTLSFCLALASQLFSPQHLADFGESVVYATLSLSNFLFWSESSYFDQENLFKPLLHTWSLSIEEQFYLIWPTLLVVLYSRVRSSFVPAVLLLLGVGSLILNLYFLQEGDHILAAFAVDADSPIEIHSSLFYLLPFRVFEFVLGAILVWSLPTRNRYRQNEILFLVGLALIGYSLLVFSSQTVFPYINALWPCVGAALIIYSGPDHKFSTLLSNKFMVGVGLISYSLYLIHWPLIIFYNYWKFEPLAVVDYVGLAASSLVLATLMYLYVEQPFRKPKSGMAKSNRPFLGLSLTLAATLCLISWNAHSSSGWLWRYPASVVEQLSYKKGDYTEFFWNKMISSQGDFADTSKPKVLVVGDSMAADLVNVLNGGALASNIEISTLKVEHHCRGLLPLDAENYEHYYQGNAERCLNEHMRLANDPRLDRADAVILASYWWEPWNIRFLTDTIRTLNENYSAKIFVSSIKDQVSDGMLYFTKNVGVPQIDKLRTPIPAKVREINSALENIDADFVLINLMDEFCDSSMCQRVTADRHVIIFDQSHLSPEGAKFVGEKIMESAWVEDLLGATLK